MTSARFKPMLFTSIWTSSAAWRRNIQTLDFQDACITIFAEANNACHHFSSNSVLHLRACNTQSFPVVCDSPSPGTSWRNRENPAPLRAHASATIGTETVATLVKVRRMQLCAFLCLLCGRETHASTTQSDPLLLPTRNGPCREDGAPRWEYLF